MRVRYDTLRVTERVDFDARLAWSYPLGVPGAANGSIVALDVMNAVASQSMLKGCGVSE